MRKEYKYFIISSVSISCIIVLCLALIIAGAATPFISSFAVDKSNRLYVGTQNEIRVYADSLLVDTISPKTSKSYAFTINKDQTITLAASTNVYTMDLKGNVLQSQTDPGANMYNQIQYRKRKFISHNGDEYRLVSALGWTRIVKNGEETVYRISPLSFATKILLAVCIAAAPIFPLWVMIQKAKGRTLWQ
jgi:hypothetical protein